MMGILGATWAVIGFSALILFALWRLTPLALDAFACEMQWHHWAAMIVNILFMTYSEAYKGFHKAFSPRAAARAKYLLENPSWLHSLLARPGRRPGSGARHIRGDIPRLAREHPGDPPPEGQEPQA